MPEIMYMIASSAKFVRLDGDSPRRATAAFPIGNLWNVLDNMSMGKISDLLAARGMRLSQQELVALIDKVRRVAAGDTSVSINANAEVAFEILSRLRLPGYAREKFTPIRSNPAAPGQVSGIAYEAGLQALLRGVSSEPGIISGMLPWLRSRALPVDHFLNMPVHGLSLMQRDFTGQMRPVSSRSATVNDLLTLQHQSPSSSVYWAVSDVEAIRRSIQDAVQVLRPSMNHNARAEAILQGITNTMAATAVATAASVGGGIALLSDTLPDTPNASSIHQSLYQASQSSYKVPSIVDNNTEAGAPLRRPDDVPISQNGVGNNNSGLSIPTPGFPGGNATGAGMINETPSGWSSLPMGQQPLPSDPGQVQRYNLQTDDWLSGRNSSMSSARKFTRI